MGVESESHNFFVDFNLTVLDSEVGLIANFRHITTKRELEVDEVFIAIFLLENIVIVINKIVGEVRSDGTEVTVFDVLVGLSSQLERSEGRIERRAQLREVLFDESFGQSDHEFGIGVVLGSV